MSFKVIFTRKLDAKGNFREVPSYFFNGKRVSEQKFNKLLGQQTPKVRKTRPTRQALPKWPLKSSAMGVHPSQKAEAEAHAAKLGVPTEFDSKGRAVFRDRGHRRAFLHAYGAVDHDGGYGDG